MLPASGCRPPSSTLDVLHRPYCHTGLDAWNKADLNWGGSQGTRTVRVQGWLVGAQRAQQGLQPLVQHGCRGAGGHGARHAARHQALHPTSNL